MDKTKEDILQEKSVKEVFLWIQKHPEQVDARVISHFNSLAKKEYQKRHPCPYFLPTPPKKNNHK